MTETGLGLIAVIQQQPLWLQAWVGWLIFVNFAVPMLFIANVEARLTIAAFVLGSLIMEGLFAQFGFTKILGLAHLIVWPPLLFWLATRWYGIDNVAMRIWLLALFVSNTTSLLIDGVEVARFIIDRA